MVCSKWELCFMHYCAKFCNSRPFSAAVVASVDSVLYFSLYWAVLLYCPVWSGDWYTGLGPNTAISSRLQNCVNRNVHSDHLCKFWHCCEKSWGWHISTVWYFTSPIQLWNWVGGHLCAVFCTHWCPTVHCSVCNSTTEHSAQCALHCKVCNSFSEHKRQQQTAYHVAGKLHQAVKAKTLHLMPSEFIVYMSGQSNFDQAVSLDPNSLFLPAVTTLEFGFKLQNMGLTSGCRALQAFQHACWFLFNFKLNFHVGLVSKSTKTKTRCKTWAGGCRALQAFQHACWFLRRRAATAEIRVVQLTASDF